MKKQKHRNEKPNDRNVKPPNWETREPKSTLTNEIAMIICVAIVSLTKLIQAAIQFFLE